MEREQPFKKVACMKQCFQQNPTLKPFKWKSLSRTLCDFVYNTVKGGYNIFSCGQNTVQGGAYVLVSEWPQ